MMISLGIFFSFFSSLLTFDVVFKFGDMLPFSVDRCVVVPVSRIAEHFTLSQNTNFISVILFIFEHRPSWKSFSYDYNYHHSCDITSMRSWIHTLPFHSSSATAHHHSNFRFIHLFVSFSFHCRKCMFNASGFLFCSPATLSFTPFRLCKWNDIIIIFGVMSFDDHSASNTLLLYFQSDIGHTQWLHG